MHLGAELCGTYLDLHFPATGQPRTERVSGAHLQRLLWPFIELLRERTTILREISFDPVFQDTADDALRVLAVTGTFETWTNLPAGAWKALECRWGWSMAFIRMEEAAGTNFSIPVPRDAPEPIREKTALLAVLGTPGRTPPRRWLDEFRGTSDGAFLATLPTWRQ